VAITIRLDVGLDSVVVGDLYVPVENATCAYTSKNSSVVFFKQLCDLTTSANLYCLNRQIRLISNVNKKSPANANGNAQRGCMLESPVKQNQLPEGVRRPTAKLFIVFYSYLPEKATCLDQPTPYRLKIANFFYPFSFSVFVRGDLLRIYEKLYGF